LLWTLIALKHHESSIKTGPGKIWGLDRDFEDRFDFETNCACKLFPSSMTKKYIYKKIKKTKTKTKKNSR